MELTWVAATHYYHTAPLAGRISLTLQPKCHTKSNPTSANSRVQGFHWTTSVKRRPTLEKEIKFRKNVYYAMSIGTKAHAKTSTTPDRIKICQDNPGRADTVSSLPYYQDKFHHQVHLVPEWFSLFCARNLSQEWCASDVCQENYIWVQLSI